MAFVIKNTTSFVGEVKIDGEWQVIKPGSSITTSVKPISLTAGLKCFPINDSNSGNVAKRSHNKGKPKSEKGSADGVSFDDSSESTGSVTLN